jgi:hypothetical protein
MGLEDLHDESLDDREPDYSPRVDAVLDGKGSTREFTTADWLLLAHAALDQAGRRYASQAKAALQASEEERELARIEGWEAAE